jgi:methionyl-tRNA formyltransferase
MKNCILFSSADNDNLHNSAVEIISKKFNIKNSWRLNRESPGINSLKSQVDLSEKVDYIFNFLSPKIFPNWLLDHAKNGCINFHPGSFLYPGIGSASYSLFDKQSTYGVTAHFMNHNIDQGEIIAERFFPQSLFKDCATLFNRALEECIPLLSDVVNLLEESERPKSIRSWSRKAVTRKEFEAWMTLLTLETNLEWDSKIEALLHPTYPGPVIQIGPHKFFYCKD